jgi:capsular exopolysaccharide synthesis family protein
MSRIDEALRVWERANGRVSEHEESRPGRPVSGRFLHHEYPREGTATVAEPHEGNNGNGNGKAQHAVDEVVTAARVVPGWRPSGEYETRLMTAETDAAPREQYRRLAAALHDMQVSRRLKTLMVTSALPAEGKTLTVINLALTLSDSYGRRVLVIDADFRAPSIHVVLGVPNTGGLSDALREGTGVLRFTELTDNLNVLTSGEVGRAPLAALCSPRMDAVIRQCAAQFDWVLIDTPPVGVMPDAQLLARQTGAVLFVIGAGVAPVAVVERAIADVGPDYIVGTLLNRVDDHSIPEGGYYDYYRGPSRK